MPTVERILPCRGGKSVSVILSDGRKVRISRMRLGTLHLEPGKDAPATLLELLEKSLSPEKARDTAARIALRPVFSDEVRNKLIARGFSQENTEDAVSWLQRIGAVDDRETLALFLREAARRGKGRKAVRYELLRRGVDPDDLEGALASYDGEDAAFSLLKKKLGGLTDRDSLRRGAGLLYAKGFERDSISRILQRYLEEASEDISQ